MAFIFTFMLYVQAAFNSFLRYLFFYSLSNMCTIHTYIYLSILYGFKIRRVGFVIWIFFYWRWNIIVLIILKMIILIRKLVSFDLLRGKIERIFLFNFSLIPIFFFHLFIPYNRSISIESHNSCRSKNKTYLLNAYKMMS